MQMVCHRHSGGGLCRSLIMLGLPLCKVRITNWRTVNLCRITESFHNREIPRQNFWPPCHDSPRNSALVSDNFDCALMPQFADQALKRLRLPLSSEFVRFQENSLLRFGQFVGMGQQQRHLPHLRGRELLVESRHAGKSDTVRDLPVSLARLIIGHPLTLEKMRGTREFAFGNCRLVFSGNSMADRALLHVNASTSHQIGFVRWNRYLRRHLFFPFGRAAPCERIYPRRVLVRPRWQPAPFRLRSRCRQWRQWLKS